MKNYISRTSIPFFDSPPLRRSPTFSLPKKKERLIASYIRVNINERHSGDTCEATLVLCGKLTACSQSQSMLSAAITPSRFMTKPINWINGTREAWVRDHDRAHPVRYPMISFPVSYFCLSAAIRVANFGIKSSFRTAPVTLLKLWRRDRRA